MITLVVGSKSVGSDNYVELIVLLLVFVLILFAAYYVTKFVAKKGLLNGKTRNIEIVESFRINQNKIIEIIRVGKKYVVVGVSKEHIDYLTEVELDDLEFTPVDVSEKDVTFKEVIQNVVKGQKRDNKDEQEKNNGDL